MVHIDITRYKWVPAIAAIALLYNAISGIRTGKVTFVYSEYCRSENPVVFWTGVVLSATVGVGCAFAVFLT